MHHLLLLNFVRLGNYAASHLGDALNQSDFNLTQAMICWQMALFEGRRKDEATGVTLTELAGALHMPQTRLHNQLQALNQLGLIRLQRNLDELDKRKKFYLLTEEGVRRTQIFHTIALKAESEVGRDMQEKLIPRRAKDVDKWIAIQQQFISDYIGSM